MNREKIIENAPIVLLVIVILIAVYSWYIDLAYKKSMIDLSNGAKNVILQDE